MLNYGDPRKHEVLEISWFCDLTPLQTLPFCLLFYNNSHSCFFTLLNCQKRASLGTFSSGCILTLQHLLTWSQTLAYLVWMMSVYVLNEHDKSVVWSISNSWYFCQPRETGWLYNKIIPRRRIKAEVQWKDKLHLFTYKTLLCGITFSSVTVIMTLSLNKSQMMLMKSCMEFSKLRNMLYINNFFGAS